MAQLRGDSTCGGKPIVTLDVMNTFVEQIQGVGLKAKINKFEDSIINNFNTTDSYIKDKEFNGFYQLENAINNDNKYNYGLLANLSQKRARFQLYAPNKEGTYSALYFRTGWDNDIKSWERIVTHTTLNTELNKKYDKTGGTISGAVNINSSLSATSSIISNNGFYIGANKSYGLTNSSNNGLKLFSNSTTLTLEDSAFKYKNYDIWHTGNFNPNDYVSKTATLLTASTNLNTITTTGYYRCNTPVNAPSKITGWAYIEVINHSSTYCLQKTYSYDGLHTYSRTLNNNSWTTWRPLGGGLSFTKSITASNWTASNNIYEMTVTHNIGSENITSVIVTDSNKVSMFTGFQVVSSTVIKVFSDTNITGKIVINAIT